MNLICIRHPHYDGNSSPVLTCKTCCSLYIAAVKEKNGMSSPGQKPASESDWLKEKKREAEAAMAKRSHAALNPFSI